MRERILRCIHQVINGLLLSFLLSENKSRHGYDGGHDGRRCDCYRDGPRHATAPPSDAKCSSAMESRASAISLKSRLRSSVPTEMRFPLME